MDFDSSNHICLRCNQRIVGLINYIDHFKSHNLPSDSQTTEEHRKTPPWQGKNDKVDVELKGHLDPKQHTNQGAKYLGTCSGGTSPLSEFIDNADDFPDPDLDTDGLMTQKHCPDFFQSLELKSATDDNNQPPRPKVKAVQKLSILDDDSHAESLLPITSILSNLDFSSDEEFLQISDNDDTGSQASDDGFWLVGSSDSQSSSHPPQGHTGGKWNPGEAPKRRVPIAGKWRPGCGPGPACRKNILRKPFKLKCGGKNNTGRTFYCNVCDSSFSDRSAYTLHFSQQKHNELAEAKKHQKNVPDLPEDSEKCGQNNNKSSAQVNSSPELTTKPRNIHDALYCSVCDLYFDNASVFSVHCGTKLHKEKVHTTGSHDHKSSNENNLRTMTQDAPPASHVDSRYSDNADSQIPVQSTPQTHDLVREQESHSCHICQKHFARKYEMARHLLTRMHRARAQEHPEALSVDMLNRYNKYMIRLSLYQCGMCQYYCNRQGDFLDHMGGMAHVMTCQDMLGPIMCVACKFKTHKHDQMMEHLQLPEHLIALERKHGMCIVRESHSRITCKFCGVKMHSAVRMLRHCQHKHKDRLTECQMLMYVRQAGHHNLHKCPLCDKAFRAKSLLQLHFLKVHKNTSLFNCAVCNRGYLDQRRLDNHLRTRFHAKRVIESKLKGAQRIKVAALKKSAVMDRTRKKRGLKKRTKEPTKPLQVKKQSQVVDDKHIETKAPLQVLRRSSRKRKKMEFYDDDGSDEDRKQTWAKKSQRNVPAVKSKMRKGTAESCDATPIAELDKISGGKVKLCRAKHEKLGGVDNSAKLNGDQHSDQPLELAGDGCGEGIKIGVVRGAGDVDEETLNEASKHIFSCAYCDFAAVELTDLREHYNMTHPNEILTCQPCNQYFLSVKAYKIHCSGRGHQIKLKEQTGETQMHKCPICDKRFLQESCCLLHLETVHRHPSSESDLQRINKGQDLVTQLYGDHVKQVESLSNESSVSCPECGKFVRKDTLVEHLRLHTGERPYICRFCSKGFVGRLTLRRHISTHLNMPMFMCDTCGKEFKRNGHLIKHIRQHDFEKKGEKHTCHICQAWFYTPEELSKHMRRHGERNYKCTWPGCHWTFILNGELKSHMFTHTGEKTYLCDICGFGAPTKTRLRRHEKIHDKSRNYNCDYCLYKASCKTHLKRHMRIHINSRPFSCPYCNYTCNTHENIRKHILKTQKHKGMKLYPCKLCDVFGCDTSKEFRAHLMTAHEDYLRANAIDSLSVFSGLYKKEEDYQKPKEGSEIIQVTKGRFFRSYQNPDAPMEPPKPKKPKKQIMKQKMEEVTVRIVPPSELEEVDRLSQKEDLEDLDQQRHHQFHDEKPLLQNAQLHRQIQRMDVECQEEEMEEPENEESTSGVNSPQYINVSNMVIPSFSHQESQLLTGATVSFTTAPQQLPMTVSISEEKLFWTVVPEQKVILPTGVPQAPEPWYSGMPQVHAPSSQELQQYGQIGVTTSHSGTFIPNSYYCNIPVNDIQSIQGGQIYTGIMENLVVINDPSRSEVANL